MPYTASHPEGMLVFANALRDSIRGVIVPVSDFALSPMVDLHCRILQHGCHSGVESLFVGNLASSAALTFANSIEA